MALRGMVITNDYQDRIYIVKWTATQNVVTNTSKINWELEVFGGLYTSYEENLLRVYVDAGAPVFSKTDRVTRYEGVISSGYKTLSHNNNGDKSFTIEIEVAINSSVPNLAGRKTFTLDKIDRNSTIDIMPDFNAEDSFTIDITKSPAAKSHTMQAYIGSKLIRTWNTVTSGDTYQFTSGQIDEIYKALPNSKQGTLSFKLRTYSDTNKSNQIGSIHTRNVSITLSKGATCDIQIKADDIVSGTMVAGVSRPTFTITDVVPSPHASIKSYNIKVKDFFDVNRQEYVSGAIPSGITQMVVEASVTDSRGNVGRATKTLTILPYSAPSISRFEIYRSDENGQADSSGSHVRVHMQASVAPLTVNEVDGNNIKWNLYSKVRGTTSWGTPIDSGTAATELGISRTNSGYSATNSYDFKLEVIDNYNTTISLGIVPTAGYTMSWGKEGVGIGKVLEQGTLDIGGDTYINDNTIHSSKKGEFWNHKSDDISGWMTWYNNSLASARVGILTPNNEKFSIESKYGNIELDSKNEITLVSNGKKATFSNGVFENDERFSIVSKYGNIELDSKKDITLASNGSSATFSNGVFKTVQESTPTFYNGWKSSSPSVKAIKTVDGMVHLQGVIGYGSTSSGTQMLRLPVGMRPASGVATMAWNTDGNSVIRCDISRIGYMTVYKTSGTIIYLDGISFYAGE